MGTDSTSWRICRRGGAASACGAANRGGAATRSLGRDTHGVAGGGRASEEEEWPPPEAADAQASVEEWTAGLVRPQREAEAPELEEESLGAEAQPAGKEPDEAEEEGRYGI